MNPNVASRMKANNPHQKAWWVLNQLFKLNHPVVREQIAFFGKTYDESNGKYAYQGICKTYKCGAASELGLYHCVDCLMRDYARWYADQSKPGDPGYDHECPATSEDWLLFVYGENNDAAATYATIATLDKAARQLDIDSKAAAKRQLLQQEAFAKNMKRLHHLTKEYKVYQRQLKDTEEGVKATRFGPGYHQHMERTLSEIKRLEGEIYGQDKRGEEE